MQFKKLLTLALLGLGVIGEVRAQTCATTINAYPYFENFEGPSATDWKVGGTASSWGLGTPTKTVLKTAASGTKAWVTNLTGNYSTNERSFVEGPCFNMSALTKPAVEFKIYWKTEFSADGAVLQSSIDNGTTWQNVGAMGDPFNWYNDNSINGAPGGQSAGTAQGWTGSTTTGGSIGWVTARHELVGLAGKPNVKLRIAFGSDFNNNDEGVAFDDFMVYETPANDAGITSITSPGQSVVPGTLQPVTVTVKNFGSSPLTAASLKFSVNGVAQPAFAWTGNLASGAASAPVQIGSFTFATGPQNIKAWSSAPNNATDPFAANDSTAIVIYSCNPLAGNYTINKGAAASATNFTSFAAVAQMLGNCGVSGPVTITVAANSGPYNEQVILPAIQGTSATSMVTFEGSGNVLTLNTSGNSLPGIFVFNGADYVKLNNLTINADAAATKSCGVQFLNGSENDIVSNCTINLPLTSFLSEINGIVTGPQTTLSGNHGSKLTFQNNTINGGYYGIFINGPTVGTTFTNNQILNNQILDSYAYGMYLNGAGSGTVIEGNDISRPNRVNAGSLTGIFLGSSTINTMVSKNRIHNTHDKATSTTGGVNGIHTTATATVGNENIIKNNLIYNLNNAGGTVYALYNQNGSGTYYYHNTVSLDNPAISYSTLRGMYFASGSTNVKFINNILSLTSPATAKHAIFVGDQSLVMDCNYNDLYVGATGKIGSYNTADKATLADWQTVKSNAYDQNSVSADPYFVSLSQPKPTTPFLNNIGQALPAVTEDITGTTRNATTPDPGAYEFTPAVNDAGISAIAAPVSPVIPGSQAVQVNVKNFGTAALTGATINWSVNGVLQTPYTWSGNLTSLQTSPAVTIGNFTFNTGNYILKSWTQNPNGATDPIALNDSTTLKIISCNAMAGNFTIDKNSPASATNFLSITEAINRLTVCGISAPVTITVAANSGPYNEQVEITNIPNASATNTVTFEGSGNTVSATPTGKFGIFVLNGAKYVKLNNFVITLPATATTGWGIQLINAADNNTISNNTINLPIASTANSINGIVAATGVNSTGNNTNNTKIQNNIINGGYYGILINGNNPGANAVNNQITGNQVKDAYFYSIYLSNAVGTLVEGNDISRPARTVGANIYGVYVTANSVNTIISKNRIHNTHDMIPPTSAGTTYGIFVSVNAPVGSENIIKNNVIYNVKNNKGTFYGLSNSGNGAYYFHNTVVTDTTNTYQVVRGFYSGSPSTNVKLINNIFSLAGDAITKHGIYLTGTAYTLQSDNNDLFLGTTGVTGFYSADKITLADWKTANTNAYDQNSVAIDPEFINIATGNLKPIAPTLDNLGQAVPTVTEDILGGLRHAVTPDLGAYEFGIPVNDVGITAISGPSTTGCGLSNAETITVTFKNFGANTQTAVPLTYSINGVPMAATPETYTGSLAPNATATYSFTAKADLSVSGPYLIVAATSLAGDITTANDTDTLKVVNALIAGLPQPFNFETATSGISRFQTITNARSAVFEGTAASNGTGSKGLIMDGVDHFSWTPAGGLTSPWTINSENFAGAYFCFSPAGGNPTDPLFLSLDLKQLFKGANANTNFRITVNGTQVGSTYRPPFTGTPIDWQKIYVDLSAYKGLQTIQIGLESSVKEAFANGAGTANLVDNIRIQRLDPTGMKETAFAAQLHIFPNPSTGNFYVSLPQGKTCQLEITDLTGKVMLKQQAKGDTQLNLENNAKGIYLLKVSSENGTAVRKLIVE